MFKSYEQFSEGFSKLTLRSPFLSFLFGGVCLILSVSYLLDINEPVTLGGLFGLSQLFLEPPLSNIVNAIFLLVIAVILIFNGFNKKPSN